MFELILLCAQDQVETISEALLAFDALSVSVEDADAHTDQEQALFGEPGMPAPASGWLHSRVVALFAEQALAEQAAQLLKIQDFFDHANIVRIAEVPPQDWVRLTQSQFEPVEITPELWVVPTWHEAPAQASKVIRLDPGLAFGTGTHPTTRMSLRWIAQHLEPASRVLDYGCGSGILAIGAAMCGAQSVDAVDIDTDAVTSAQANAAANHVLVNTGLPDMAQGVYDLVVANILAAPLKVLAPLLCGHVQQGGHLILAGILSRQVEEIQLAYAPYIQLQVADTQDGWVLMAA
ncbi:MAG: 50S ribosomal protein L11 methyltransferase [Betaproteobacteria bacterium]|nr:50S ribosomal protein L11 methyltransferase [Betaproteobacteria bacterium]NBY33974.1 50S ribosomal protein L11 methyltransferase [Betaproteobacteria bacterium]